MHITLFCIFPPLFWFFERIYFVPAGGPLFVEGDDDSSECSFRLHSSASSLNISDFFAHACPSSRRGLKTIERFLAIRAILYRRLKKHVSSLSLFHHAHARSPLSHKHYAGRNRKHAGKRKICLVVNLSTSQKSGFSSKFNASSTKQGVGGRSEK